MLLHILQQTPTWVWGIFVVLIGLGLAQSVGRTVKLRRVVVLPVVMTLMSIHGTFSAIPSANWSWVLWLGAAMVTITWFASGELPAGARYDARQRVFHLPGSWAPMALMMAIFLTRYAVGVALAIAPALAQDVATAAIVSSVYGALSGVFVGRMLRLLRATRTTAVAAAASTVAWG